MRNICVSLSEACDWDLLGRLLVEKSLAFRVLVGKEELAVKTEVGESLAKCRFTGTW